jgi:hypothetical protein
MRALRSLVVVAPPRLRPAVAIAAMLALAACGGSTPRPEPAPDVEMEEESEDGLQGDSPLEIDNRNWSDVVVILIRNNGQRTRIGTVNAATKAVLRLPGHYLQGSATLQLVARPIGGWGEYRSERFVVQRGQEVVWTLESGLERSSLAVY